MVGFLPATANNPVPLALRINTPRVIFFFGEYNFPVVL